ncbi:MAG: hypothetical protein AAFO95_06335, partial [Cyanobacteria bacterium J06600_6]
EEDLLSFDVSFFDPDGNLLRTYTDNQDLSRYPTFNFAFDTQTQKILQDGTWDVDDDVDLSRNGFMFGEGNPDLRSVEGAQSGLAFWTRPSDDKLPHLHVDDWNNELGFPIGYSSHEDVGFPTLTVADLIDNGKVGETYLDEIQDSLDEVGETILVTPADSSTEPSTESPVIDETALNPVFGTLDADVIEIDESNQLVFAGSGDDLIDFTQSPGDNRAFAGGGDDILILGENNRVFADDGDDRIFITSGGNNSINGNLGADQFWIANAEIPESTNIINDFTSGEDVIGIAGLGIGFSDLDITDFEGGTLISANGNDLAVINNAPASFIANENHFAFA